MDNNNNSFKQVKDKNKKYSIPKGKVGFFRGFFMPFLAGALGSILLIGTAVTVSPVRNFISEKFFNAVVQEQNIENTNMQNTLADNSQSSSNAQVSIKDFSETSISVANKVLPSVVGIQVTYSVNSPYYSFYGLSGATSTASGSGVIISEDGYILTNNHVVSTTSSSSYFQVSEATKITVTLYNDTTEYEAKIIGTDEQTDLAVLKIDKTGLTAAELGNSEDIKVGEFAMAIGNPLSMPSTVTTGIISATNRKIKSENTTYSVIQTDAAINSGNSGGALINAEGKVIGINTLKIAGSGVEGIGFAIPINDTINVYQQLISNGKVSRPYIGISGRSIDSDTAKQHNLAQEGVYVITVEAFSPAEKSGIQAGDLIVEFDNQKVTTMEDLNNLKNQHSIGDEVKLKIMRGTETKEISISLGETKTAE